MKLVQMCWTLPSILSLQFSWLWNPNRWEDYTRWSEFHVYWVWVPIPLKARCGRQELHQAEKSNTTSHVNWLNGEKSYVEDSHLISMVRNSSSQIDLAAKSLRSALESSTRKILISMKHASSKDFVDTIQTTQTMAKITRMGVEFTKIMCFWTLSHSKRTATASISISIDSNHVSEI